ncbi:hypothetical protein SAMN02910435_02424 [Ruminococcaceae bacterium D5]|nr:hypothetical protein SAMN02910435_02424 [Ruminococcaceae bacterium D5]
MKLDTATFDGISMSIWIWSGHISASMIFIFFQLRSVYLSDLPAFLSMEYFSPVLWRKYHMIFAIPACMR